MLHRLDVFYLSNIDRLEGIVIDSQSMIIFSAIAVGIIGATFVKLYFDNGFYISKAKQLKAEILKSLDQMRYETKQSHPWLATFFADAKYAADLKIANELEYKTRPAKKAAEEVKKIAAEKREIQRKCKQYEYQLKFLEAQFPWLIDFEQVAPADVTETTANPASDYDEVKEWLSPDEYAKLDTAQKNDLAMKRWKQRKKSPWEAGRDYERFIGYLFEKDGFTVEYEGALQGKEDRGIDLIAEKNRNVFIIQCKRYSQTRNKYVHENTVSQLYGVAAVYNMENPGKHAEPVIYTSSSLSPEAKRFATYLRITLRENCPLSDYPMIKCNISKRNEKIYHMPFDQQYDKVKLVGKKGAKYAYTAAEAEKAGFRRAKKWVPDREL